MTKKRLLPLIALLCGSVCGLVGCDEEADKSLIDENLTEIEINSLYDGLIALYQTKNYTFDIVHTFGSYRDEIPSKLFTPKYIGYDSKIPDDLDMLYDDGDGIYHVSFTDDYLCGEYLSDLSGKKYTSLWDNSLVSTMYGAGAQYLKKNLTKDLKELEVSDKDYKINFMQTIIGSTNAYASVDSLTVKYENGKVVFNLSLDNKTDNYKVTLKNVGNTASKHLRKFITDNGKPFTPNSDLVEMRRLLYKDNFVQKTCVINGNEKYFNGYQYFTEHYFFRTSGLDTTTGQAFMEFNYTNDPEEFPNGFDMWGIYLVNVGKNEQNQPIASLSYNFAYNSSTCQIEECCKYPSRKLDLLRNLEYVKEGSIRDADYEMSKEFFTGESKKYYFVDEKLVANFVDNFSLDEGFQNVTFNTVGIELEFNAEEKNSVVCFHAIGYFATDGMTYDVVIPLFGFGDARRNALEALYAQYNTKEN